MIVFLKIAAWILYSVFEGHREAYYFFFKVHANREEKEPVDPHVIFNIQRGAVWIANIAPPIISGDIAIGVEMGIILMLIFPFFHDGQYYSTRNNIDKNTYPKRWTDFGDGSAIFDFSWSNRLIMLIIGVLLTAGLILTHGI